MKTAFAVWIIYPSKIVRTNSIGAITRIMGQAKSPVVEAFTHTIFSTSTCMTRSGEEKKELKNDHKAGKGKSELKFTMARALIVASCMHRSNEQRSNDAARSVCPEHGFMHGWLWLRLV